MRIGLIAVQETKPVGLSAINDGVATSTAMDLSAFDEAGMKWSCDMPAFATVDTLLCTPMDIIVDMVLGVEEVANTNIGMPATRIRMMHLHKVLIVL